MVIYQVYPRSFQDTDGDGIGDLRGILERLGYIERLSVDYLWLGPFFRSPQRDFGYDVSDYRSVDPLFGTLDDFRALVVEARRLGIGILVDMVASHTSDQHPWFAESRARSGDKADWYLWADPKADGSPPNNWMSVFGGSAWRWDAQRRQYYYHAFLSTQPDLNLNHRPVQDQLLAEMRFWLELGAAGFRLDACGHYFQDPLLRDNPPVADPSRALHPYGFQQHVYDGRRPATFPFLERIRKLLDEFGAFGVAEVGGNDALPWMAQCVSDTRLHGAYSFDLLRTDRSAAYIRSVVERLQASLPTRDGACHALSNHDKPRVVTRWGEGRDERAFARQMLALLACLPGSVVLYQGEELGLPQADVPFERLQDPFGKVFWPSFRGRDGCRTPMPWTGDAPYGGFSDVEPWLPLDARHLALSVAAQEASSDSTLVFAREIFALRRRLPALNRGDAVFPVDDGHAAHGLLLFTRVHDGQALACAFNLGDRPLQLPKEMCAGTPWSSQALAKADARWTLQPCGFALLAMPATRYGDAG
ncbi:MAG TPA: alpha-amylase family glycosyl hydrolase [Zeimonas sp.]|nr:alpha-amylase family glycosyl hydrolase [Zeimonas sp.]